MTFTTYMLRTTGDTKVYFGFTETTVATRMGMHMRLFSLGRHFNKELQAIYNEQPNDWVIVPINTFSSKDQALADETRLVEMFGAQATNVYKNPTKQVLHHAKITSAVAAEILALKGELRNYEIAEMFDVSTASVTAIMHGDHWSSCNSVRELKDVLALMATKFLAQCAAGQNNLVSA